MAGKAGTLETVAQQVALALQPLESQLTSDNIIPFLAELGLQFPPQLLTPSFESALNAGATAAGALPNTLTQLATDITSENISGILQDGLTLIQEIGAIINALEQIGTELGSLASSLPGMNASEVTTFAANLAQNLVSYLLISYLENVQPGAVGVANLLGVINYVPNYGVPGDPSHPPYLAKQLQLSNLGTLITSPQNLLQTLYQWGSPSFDGTLLIPALRTSLGLLGLSSTVSTGPPISLTASVLTIQANPATNPPGLLATLSEALPGGINLTLPITSTWSVQLQMQGTFAAGLQATVTPPTGVAVQPPSGTLNGLLQMNLVATAPDADHSIILIGETGGSALQTNSVTIGAGVNVTWDASSGTATAAPSIMVGVSGGNAVIDMSNADGFLADVLSGVNVQAGFDLNATWRIDTGLHIQGGAQLEIDLPLHLDLGPVTLPMLYLVGGVANNAITLEVSAALGITLGPIGGSVDRLGLLVTLTFPQQGGNLGPADLQLDFKPPDGVGLEIEAEAVSGGGFISYDATKQEYAGGLELTIEMLQLKAFGVLDTMMPDGSKGYSFVIIISADFPPIELGFGFALSGVGGLLGVNRSMAIDPLRAAFRAHTLDDIVFLKGDIVSQAPTLIQGIAAIFPPLDSHFVIGPFVTITWADPALLTAELGLIISLPDPVTLAILGAIIVGVPDPDTPLILLNLDVLGTWDCDAKKIEIDASLYNSYIAAFTIQGDSAFLLNYGESPSFALSVGGLNPQFQPPPGFPTLAAMAINLGNGGNPGIGVLGYFAVTSNSIQHGAKAHLTATASGFGVDGHLGYDILIVFNPFGFMIDLHAELDILAGGGVLMSIHLDGMLSGPSPWHIHGDASFSILFFSVSVNIDATFGQSATSQNPPSVSTYTPFNAALQDYRNWSATLPPDAGRVATLAAPASAASVVVHPLGAISFQQTVVPLNLQISKFGNAIPSDGTLFTVTGVELNGTASPLSSANIVTGEFADGQFIAMSDQDKISKPSYTSHASGAVFTSGTILAPFSIETDVAYQTFVEDDLVAGPQPGSPYQPYQSTVLALSANGASARSPRRQATAQRYITPGLTSAIGVNAELYLVVSALNNNPRVDIVPTPAGYYKVEAALSTYLGSNPGEAQTLQILAAYELQEAA